MLFLHILYNMEALLVLRRPVIFPPFATLFFLLRLRRFLSGASRYTNQTFFLSRSIPTQSLTVLSDAFRHPSHPPSTYDSNGKERETISHFFAEGKVCCHIKGSAQQRHKKSRNKSHSFLPFLISLIFTSH